MSVANVLSIANETGVDMNKVDNQMQQIISEIKSDFNNSGSQNVATSTPMTSGGDKKIY